MAALEVGEDHGDSDTLHLWDIESSQLKRAYSWNPVAKEFFKDVKSVAWIDENHLLTSNFKDLQIWDVENRRLLWKIDGGGPDRFALSPNRKQLAVASLDGIIVINPLSGEVLQRVAQADSHHYGRLAFCPSGQLLAASDGSTARIALINIETGNIFDTLNLQSRAREEVSFFWPDNEHILIGGRDLVHVPSKVVVWQYRHNARHVAYSQGVCWYLLSTEAGRDRHATPVRLPHPAVANVSDDQLALRPGDSVNLELELVTDMSSSGGRSIREETEKMLTEDLEEAGYFVSESAPTTLLAVMEPGETKTVSYRRFGHFRDADAETIQVTPQKYRLELRKEKQLIWQREQVNSPSLHLELKKDESIRDAIDREMQPDPGYFGIGVPSRIMKPDVASTRHCKIVPSGLE